LKTMTYKNHCIKLAYYFSDLVLKVPVYEPELSKHCLDAFFMIQQAKLMYRRLPAKFALHDCFESVDSSDKGLCRPRSW